MNVRESTVQKRISCGYQLSCDLNGKNSGELPPGNRSPYIHNRDIPLSTPDKYGNTLYLTTDCVNLPKHIVFFSDSLYFCVQVHVFPVCSGAASILTKH